ncbi:MAG: DUF4115 domain-containing protein [Candidatus Eremiobacteraeota bacterium]|nr:DUF4115 domain-containing protein [Candidatus Eremiobacteraeota bacterium]
MSALGERFRAAREARGLSLSDVAEQIRIRSVYLSAIEDENWKAIGPAVYTRGFLRTYARFLGLDSEEAVAEFGRSVPTTSAAAGGPNDTIRPLERTGRNLSPLIWFASLVAVVMVAFVFYNELAMRHPAPGSPSAVASSGAAPSGVPESADSSSPVEPSRTPGAVQKRHLLRVSFSGSSWLRVTVDGNVSMEGTFPPGTVRTFRGTRAALRIGNAGGVDVSVDGKSIGKLGNNGDVVERSFAL